MEVGMSGDAGNAEKKKLKLYTDDAVRHFNDLTIINFKEASMASRTFKIAGIVSKTFFKLLLKLILTKIRK